MAGVIAAGNPQTAAAGADILARGGNAVDAAVAAAFASFIAEIGVVHLGGSGLAHLFDPAAGRSVVYDFFSAMPGLDHSGKERHPLLDFEEVIVDYGATTQGFHLGRGSVAVPGNIFGLCQLAAEYGRLSLETLLQPALRLAREGALLDDFQANTCELLRPLYTHTESMRAIFTPEGHMVRSGERFFIPHLEETLAALAVTGADLLRSGALAQALVADQEARGGLLTLRDLEMYMVNKAEAIRLPYRAYEVHLPPPCSTGGVLTAFTLKLLSHFPVRQMERGSAPHLRLLYEVQAATTRARPFWDKAIAERGSADAIAYFLDDDFLAPFAEEVRDALAGHRPASIAAEESGPQNTSHLSVIDGDGMAVGLTTTAGESAGYVVPRTGFIPNNILGEADLNPDGFHQWPAGARIPTMMTPLFVTSAGSIRLVTGSGGSNRIRSAILQTLSNFLDFGLPLEDAVNAPRVHVQDQVLQCEHGYDPEAVEQLEAWGYPVNRWSVRSIYFGGAHSVARIDGDSLVAAGDDRRGGAVAYV